jgi:hypothetical protein
MTGEPVESTDEGVLERGVPLSRSLLWSLQRRYFEARGTDAWSRREVPHFVTSNAFMAAAYAQAIDGFLRDRVGQAQPVLVVELGAGSGRLGLGVVVELLALRGASPTTSAPFRYVLTDVCAKTLAALSAHERLAPYLASGLVDVARLDLEDDAAELVLERSGERLDLRGPGLVVIANYVFDALPQELLRRGASGLEVGHVTMRGQQHRRDAPDLVSAVSFDTEWVATRAAYDDPELAALAEGAVPERGEVLFPVGAVRCLRRLLELGSPDVLLLAADRKECAGPDPLGGLGRHGCVSLPVSTGPLAELFRRRGGLAIERGPGAGHLWVSAFLTRPADHPEARRAFRGAVEPFGPGELLAIKRLVEAHGELLSLEQLVAAVRLSRNDAIVLSLSAAHLAAQAGAMPVELRAELRAAVHAAWERLLPIGDEAEIAFGFGLLLYSLDAPAEAIPFYERSRAQQAPDAHTLFNLALCHCKLGSDAAALACLDEVLRDVEPGHAAAAAFRAQLLGEVSPTSGLLTET